LGSAALRIPVSVDVLHFLFFFGSGSLTCGYSKKKTFAFPMLTQRGM
jgi:hypothetical protein